jgi:septum formation protein
MKIILGSKSAGRRRILSKMGYKFSIMDPDINEKSIRNKDPKKLVAALARAKAKALLPKIKGAALLITGDQVVLCNKKILEKPNNKAEARKFLCLYAKYPAKTITAITVTNTISKKQKTGVSVSTIWFRPLPKGTINKLLQKEYTMACAGGFSIERPLLKKYILKIKGTAEGITGLPVELTERLLAKVCQT